MYGVEVYQLFPQDGPFWWLDDLTGEVVRFDDYDSALALAAELLSRDDLTGFSFRVAVCPA